jgi:hypothetical protein
MRHRASFDWAFIQCGPEQLLETEYRCFLTSTIFDDPQPFFEAKFALNVIAHRLSSEKTCMSMGAGALQLISDIMQAGRNALHKGNFMRLKEHLFGLPQISTLFTSSMINSETIEQGIGSIMLRLIYLDTLTFRDTTHSRRRGSNHR